MPSPASAHRVGVALFAVGAGALLTRFVTVRHMPRPLDGGEPAYGFPLPAFGWPGASSMEWEYSPAPLAADLLTASVICGLVALLISRVLGPRTVLFAGAAAALFAGVVNAEAVVKASLGYNYTLAFWQLTMTGEGPPCRTVWLGEPEATPDWTDATDPCVQEALAELHGG